MEEEKIIIESESNSKWLLIAALIWIIVVPIIINIISYSIFVSLS